MEYITNIVYIYLIIMNIVGFLSMGVDKMRAKNGKWRIKEKTLFLVAIIGGSAGSVLGMNIFHHKTKHRVFVIGMPLILILQTICILFLFGKYK